MKTEREFLEALRSYIEGVEERIDGEWGTGKSAETLIRLGEMPEVYNEVISRLANLKPRLPVGVSVLITDHLGRVLLGKRTNNSGAGLFSTPGGRLEEHENMFQCAEREVLEEVDVHVKQRELHVLGFKEHFRFGNHYIMIYMHAARYYGVVKNTEPEKCESWDWHEIDSVDQTKCTEPAEILAHLKQRLEAL